jgi:hypothetical protein
MGEPSFLTIPYIPQDSMQHHQPKEKVPEHNVRRHSSLPRHAKHVRPDASSRSGKQQQTQNCILHLPHTSSSSLPGTHVCLGRVVETVFQVPIAIQRYQHHRSNESEPYSAYFVAKRYVRRPIVHVLFEFAGPGAGQGNTTAQIDVTIEDQKIRPQFRIYEVSIRFTCFEAHNRTSMELVVTL